MSVVEQIEKIVSEILCGKNAFIVDLSVRGTQNGTVLEVFVDTDEGITTKMCAEISREISQALDALTIFTHKYNLVVSSPGVDRPLKFLRQYHRNIGRQLLVSYQGVRTVEKLQGTLIEVNQEAIQLRSEKEKVTEIPMIKIVEAYVKTPW